LFQAYFEICEKLKDNSWKYVWNDQQEVPYAYSNEVFTAPSAPLEWVGFDDVRSIEVKVKYIMNKGLGGAMLWALDMDDFTGDFCNQGKYPLLTTVNHHLNPSLKVKLPPASVLWNFNATSKHEVPPLFESALIMQPRNAIDNFAPEFLSTYSIFSLIENDGKLL
jgi:hypothetical protein